MELYKKITEGIGPYVIMKKHQKGLTMAKPIGSLGKLEELAVRISE